MKKIFLCPLVFAGMLFSCTEGVLDGNEDDGAGKGEGPGEKEQVELKPKTFDITVTGTKTAVTESGSIEWTMDDDFSVFAASDPEGNRKFRIENIEGAGAEMSGEIADADRYYAIYPYNRRNTFSENRIYSELSGFQAAAPGTFAEYLSHAVAYTDSDEMTFRQILALVKVTVPQTGPDVTVSQIVLRGNGGEIMAGKYFVDPSAAEPEAVPAGDVNEVTLNGRFTSGENYYLAVFPQTLTRGLSLAFRTSDGGEILKSTPDQYEMEAGSVTELTESSFEDLGNNLSSEGTANCYLITGPGSYYLTMTKGNSPESVGDVASAEVLWESFGTDTAPAVGDLVSEVSVSDDRLLLTTSETFRNGNALIAAKDASGNILWSWHLWFSQDGFKPHTYANGAGVAMDRNLGAYSVQVGDVGSIGLLYQWGRKDPFLCSSGFEAAEPASTAVWPSPVASDASVGTIDYATANPMTYITGDPVNQDWLYSEGSADNSRWAEFEGTKTVYDPCPAGWRVPTGNENGLWMKAGMTAGPTTLTMDKGYVFPASICGEDAYYPAAGSRKAADGQLDGVGGCGRYWTTTPSNADIYYLDFWWGEVYPANLNKRANAYSVRCVQM